MFLYSRQTWNELHKSYFIQKNMVYANMHSTTRTAPNKTTDDVFTKLHIEETEI